MNKNKILIIVGFLLIAVICCEVAIYLGYDLYHSENGIFLRHKVYIATYENMSENIQLTMEDINFMVESALNKILGKENDLADITPDMILSDDGTIV